MSTAAGTALAINRHRLPDPDPWFVKEVVQEWYEEYSSHEGEGREFALPDSKWRGSWAGSCARQIAYKVAGVEETNPTTVADAWRFWVGKWLHDLVQQVVVRKYPGSEVEVKLRLGEEGSGHADIKVVTPEGKIVAVELKSINGTGFKMSVIGKTARARNPEGARVSAIMQGALYAYAMDPKPDELMVVYLSLELVSGSQQAHLTDEYSRFAAQWTFSRDEYEQIARDEIRRMERIVKITERSGPHAVPRVIPDPNMAPHRVTNPRSGVVTLVDDDGSPIGYDRTWMCGYCSHQDKCARDRDLELQA